MNNREIIWQEHKHGRHHPTCNCVECTRRRLDRDNEEMDKDTAYKADGFTVSLAKLGLNLAMLGAFVCLGLLAHDVVVQGSASQAEAIKGAVILILGFVGVMLLARLSTRGRLGYAQPSFALTTLSVIGIILVLGLAGVEPVANYLHQLSEGIAPWLDRASLVVGFGFLAALLSPFHVLAGMASLTMLVLIIYVVRRW